MNRISKILFSWQTMGLLILMFAFTIGAATFIENDFGATAAKTIVYNATWFNVLLILLAINLTGRIFIDKMYRSGKLTIFVFHISFLFILLGAGITRFISYEGMMHIREGEASSSILSDKTYVDVYIAKSKGENVASTSKDVLISQLNPGAYSDKVEADGKTFKFKSIAYIPDASEIITESENEGDPYIVFVFSDMHGRQNVRIKYGESVNAGMNKINFSDKQLPGQINIKLENDELFINSEDNIATMSMMTSTVDTLEGGKYHPFQTRNLYTIGNNRIVLTDFIPNGKIDYVSSNGSGNSMDAMKILVSSDDKSKEVVLRGGKGYKGAENYFSFNGMAFKMQFGSKDIRLPFSIKLKDFQLERYPGSNSPSSYASEVVVIDKANNKEFDYRIFMNNVLNYGGYRFFQSSYDKDELGTVLSVNHDKWGTFFSYVGYFLMSLGMVLSIFYRKTHFSALGRFLRNAANNRKAMNILLIGLFVTSSFALSAQHMGFHGEPKEVPEETAEKFGRIIVQSHDGRLEPMNTLTSEILRKVSRKNELDGMSSDQVILGMLSSSANWQTVKMIKIGHPEINDMLGVEGKLASYLDFIDLDKGTYKIGKAVSDAYEKKPSKRSKLDNELIKADERLNICYMVYTGDMIKLFPDPGNIDQPWYSPVAKVSNINPEDSMFIKTVWPSMLTAVADGDTDLANKLIEGIGTYQNKFAGSILPSETKLKYELMYNKMQIFNNLSRLYGLIGVIMLILLFVEMFKPSKVLKYIINFFIVIVILGFIYQTYGLAMRWYISGHAPWSDGYESMIYIAWVTLLAGLIFSHGSKMTIAATTFLSSVILMVAHLSWMDPEVTNLVPVLKSYWLTIHVSVITASYGFLALSTLLGLINLILMIFKSSGNKEKFNNKINELSAINERSVIIGLYLLTIGTFLGGIWANESWGRYWGWDPKETWALVSVLIYSFIVHMRFIPGMRGKFAFNFATLISYSSILMTYFGVNYYLSGLHSYAKGDPVPVPTFVYYSLAIVAVISILAYVKEQKNALDKK